VNFTKSEQQKLKNFHGHLGPYVLLGYKIGRLAVIKLKADHKKLNTNYYGPNRPPHTCLIDGLQIATGCTYGKRNIKINNKPGLPKIILSAGQKKFVVKLKQELTSTKQVYNSTIKELTWTK